MGVAGYIATLSRGMTCWNIRLTCWNVRITCGITREVPLINVLSICIFKQFNPFSKDMVSGLAFVKCSLKFLYFGVSNIYLLL